MDKVASAETVKTLLTRLHLLNVSMMLSQEMVFAQLKVNSVECFSGIKLLIYGRALLVKEMTTFFIVTLWNRRFPNTSDWSIGTRRCLIRLSEIVLSLNTR